MRIYRAPLIVDSPDVGARGVRIARLSWDPDSQSVAVAGSFAFSVSPLVVRTTDAVNETAATAARLPLPFSDRVAYRGNRRQLFEVDGNGVVVDAEQALPAHELFRLRHIQVATTDASGRYFLAVDASSRVFGWRPGLEKPRRLGSLDSPGQSDAHAIGRVEQQERAVLLAERGHGGQGPEKQPLLAHRGRRAGPPGTADRPAAQRGARQQDGDEVIVTPG